jgi:hypothetical protein
MPDGVQVLRDESLLPASGVGMVRTGFRSRRLRRDKLRLTQSPRRGICEAVP